MKHGRGFRRSVRLSEHAPDVHRDVEDEISLYLELRERELMEQGLTPDEAKRKAREAFGDRGRIAAQVEGIASARLRRWRAREFLASVWQDVRLGGRGLVHSPGFAIAAVATLALGIGANAMVFGLLEAALLRGPAAVRSPETLAAVYTTCRRGDPRCASSYPDYRDYRHRTRAFADLAAYVRARLALGDAAGAEVVNGEMATGNYFTLLDVRARLGRTLVPADDHGEGARVVVLSDAFWRRRYGGNPEVVGRSVRLNDVPYTVVGVAAPAFTGLRLGNGPDLWAPLHGMPGLFPSAIDRSLFESRRARWIGGLVARLANGVSLARARADLRQVSAELFQEDSVARGPRTVTVDPLTTYILPAGNERVITSFVWVLQTVVAFTLLVACANLANLLLARGAARRRDLSVCSALGAGRSRLVRQLLTESLLLGVLGGVAGLGAAALGLHLVAGFRLPFGFDVGALGAGINGPVAVFTACVALATVVGFGTLPALQAVRGDLASALREGRGGPGRAQSRLLGGLVGVQVALCVVLLTGAGLFLRTLANRLRTDLGFQPQGVALVTLDPSMNSYAPERVARLIGETTTRIAALPGVQGASAGTRVPVRRGGAGTFVEVAGYTPAPDEEMRVEYNYVAPDYFHTLGLPLLRGREFTAADGPGARCVIVVNQDMARAWWPSGDAIGGRVTFRGRACEVVGIARDAAWSGLQAGGSPYVYAPVLQNADRVAEQTLTLIARTDPAHLATLMPLLRRTVHEFDPALAISTLGSMAGEIDTTLASQRGAALFLSGFAALALLLATVGIYGVVSYGVAQRRRDFGIRLALGARSFELVALAARGMSAPILAGVAGGLLAGIALARTVQSLMYDVAPTDPWTLAGTVGLLTLAALLATLIPARRATRADPLEIMRTE